MVKGFDITWIGVQYTMGRSIKILWVRGQNSVETVFDIPWVEGSKYYV